MIKIYDFNDSSAPSGIIGRPRELAWPCQMYRVTIPKYKPEVRSLFNAFEVCILKLLSYGRYEPKQLTEETCLPPDLIEIILLRLYDNGYIDNSYNLSETALKALEKHDEEKDTVPTEYEVCVIFRDLIGGKLLPMLIEANLRSEDVNERRDIVKGEDYTIRLHHLTADEQNFPVPKAHDVLSVLRAMLRRKKITKETYHIPSARYISVVPKPDMCELRVRMVIQRCNSDWRILNPFGTGWSLELESAYSSFLEKNSPESVENRTQESEDFKNWQKYINRDASDNAENSEKEPYDNTENWSNYPQLLKTFARGRRKKDGVENGTDIYTALEWTLYYALWNSESTKNCLQQLQINSVDGRTKLVKEAIDFLNLSDKNIKLHKLLDRKLQSFQNDEMAEMQVVLPINLFVSQEDSDYPFNKVVKKHPDILSWITELKTKRDKKAHGNSIWTEIYGKDDYPYMKDVISTLLPSVVFSETQSAVKSDNESIADIRLKARIALQEYFGIVSFDRMDSILQNELLQAEMFRNDIADVKEFDALQCINNLYAAVQCACRLFLANERSQKSMADQSSLKELAIQNAKEVGWDDFPMSLQTVRQDMIQRTFQGDDQTLGASVVCILLLDIDCLRQLASSLPTFLSDIDNLLAKRKHGNKACMMQKEELNSLVTSIYKIIRTILEV